MKALALIALGAVALVVGERPERMGADVAGVHPLVEEVDGLALAGAVDAVHEDDHRELVFLEEPVLEVEQALAHLRLLALEARLVELVADLRGFEHAVSP